MDEFLTHFHHQLDSLHHTTSSGDSFFVFEELKDLVTESVINNITRQWIPEPQQGRAVDLILKDGVRLLCALSMLNSIGQIPNFLSHNTLDSRLPIKAESEILAVAPELPKTFYSTVQWQFFPWVLGGVPGHGVLPEKTVVPFVREIRISEGSGGILDLVEVPRHMQRFVPDQDTDLVKLVRKRIKSRRTAAATERLFEQEKSCLELYHTLQHSNIIQLLGSFTLKGEHSLLFPYYPMDLEAFLKCDKRFGDFHQDSTFTAALADLASALESVHEANIRSKKTPTFINSYGYHHDIRPANILVTPSTFILADFGLAYPTPVTTSQPPLSVWTENIGHYIAPECMDQDFQPQKVGRSYDIWAFGCLVAEITTYMHYGPAGIQDFRQKRLTPKYYDENFENGYFFQGSSLKPSVCQWLKDLADSSANVVTSSLVGLCRDMLQYQPQNREGMTVAHIRLSFIHSKSLFQKACSLMDDTVYKFGQPRYEVSAHTVCEFKAETSKLKAFGTAVGLDDGTRLDSELFSNHSFTTTVQQCLEQIADGLHQSRRALADYQRAWAPSAAISNSTQELIPLKFIDDSVRQGIRALSEALPTKYQTVLSYLWLKKLSEEVTVGRLDGLQDIEALGEASPGMYSGIGLRARLLRLNEALHGHLNLSPEERDLVLDWSQVKMASTFSRYHHVGSYYPSDLGSRSEHLGSASCKVMVEWIFPSQFAEDESEDERIDKLLRLANLLKCPKPTGFRVLTCMGFLPPQENTHQGFGFVYKFPEWADEMEPKTLRQLLEQRNRSIRLGDRFKLAKNLSLCLFEFHAHGWLHKNIRSENVMFFARNDDRQLSSSKFLDLDHGPFVIGTHHSRPDNAAFHSDVPSSDVDAEVLLYQHPDYNPQGNRFEKTYDYYSLGVVLLEIAYWYPVQAMRAKIGRSECSPSQFRTKLIEKFVPKLSEIMGDAYREATLMCLSEDLGSSEQGGINDKLTSKFYWDVLQKLDACYVG